MTTSDEQELRARLADDIATRAITVRLAADRERAPLVRALVLREAEGLALAEAIVRGTR